MRLNNVGKEITVNTLDGLLNSVTVGTPQILQDITIFPLFNSMVMPATLLELDEALENDLAQVAEVTSNGSVPELTVINKSTRDIILFAGEQLIGAKQNRVVNITVIIPANSTLPIPVSCVEQGRWHYKSKAFASGDAFAYPKLRQSMHEDVTDSKRSRGRSDSNQSRIWHDLSEKISRMSVDSETMAMADIYESRSLPPELLTETFRVEENQIGYIAFIKGGFAGGDLFGSTGACRRKMEKLVRGYYLDSLDAAVAFERIEIPEILRELRDAQSDDFGTVGKGTEKRFEAAHVQGSWMELDGVIQHLTILPKAGA
jgi:hypothetical protein